jgi:hypothetical protein
MTEQGNREWSNWLRLVREAHQRLESDFAGYREAFPGVDEHVRAFCDGAAPANLAEWMVKRVDFNDLLSSLHHIWAERPIQPPELG